MENARFIAFTSALGGSGTTSLALVLGRTLTRLYGKEVMYISLDFISGKGIPSGSLTTPVLFDFYQKPDDEIAVNNLKSTVLKDEYGLYFLTSKETINPFYGDRISFDMLITVLSSMCEILLIDVPSNCCFNKSLSNCEDIVVNYGFKSYGKELSEKYSDYLSRQYELSNIHKFVGINDEYSFEKGKTDIHGEFASEVRELVTKLKV